jgi:hypothetical protein
MVENPDVVKALLSARVRDIPDGFYASFVADGYEVTIDFDREDRPQIIVRLVREGYGKDSELDIRDPDPDLTVWDVVSYAKEVIQSFVRKR